jgi:hypothetical protein
VRQRPAESAFCISPVIGCGEATMMVVEQAAIVPPPEKIPE